GLDADAGKRESPGRPSVGPLPAARAAGRASMDAAAPCSGPPSWLGRSPSRLSSCQSKALLDAKRRFRNIAIAMHRIIPPQWMPFKVIWQQNPPQIGVSGKANPEQIKDFTLQP